MTGGQRTMRAAVLREFGQLVVEDAAGRSPVRVRCWSGSGRAASAAPT